MIKNGYKVSHISTEPQGELLGATFSFPMGYNPTVKLPQTTWPDFLSLLSKAIEYYIKPDLIISGIQSCTIPLAFSNASVNAFRSLYYLIGLAPDGIICSINPNDPVEMIKRNVAAMEMVSKAKVLFYTISPIEIEHSVNKGNILVSKQRMLSNKEFAERISYYKKQLNAPVMDILNQDNQINILNIMCH